MSRVEGYVDHIRFRNPDNGYTVLSLDMSGGEETLGGIFNFINEVGIEDLHGNNCGYNKDGLVVFTDYSGYYD